VLPLRYGGLLCVWRARMSETARCQFEATLDAEGKLHPRSTAIVRARLARWAGKRVLVTVEKEKKVRSDPQNRLLWGLIYEDLLAGLRELAVEAGEKCPFRTKDELHEAMKHVFIGPTVVKVPGAGEMEIPPRSRSLTTDQFSEFISQILKWAAERGIYCRTGYEEWTA
jgi:hypothetical protein